MSEMINEAFELSKYPSSYANNYKAPLECVIHDTMWFYQFDPDDSFLSYSFTRAKKDHPRFCANIVCIETQSNDLLINSLMNELNELYEAVYNIQPDISKY